MSLIVYDFKCTECGTVDPDVFVHRDDVDHLSCHECGMPMERLMPGPTTTFKQGDRSAFKSKKKVSLRDPQHGARATGSEGLD